MKIGKIISVEYDKFRVRLFHTTRNSTVNIDGKVYYFGNIGSYMKTVNSSGEYVMCEVASIVDWVGKDNQVYSSYNLDSSREIIIKPIGTLKGKVFSMGVGIFPSLYSDVEIVTYDDLDNILSYNETGAEEGVHECFNIGCSKSLINYAIALDINRLFNIHTAVLGNSGSGKSNTIAHILHEIYRKGAYSALGAKTIIFDANGEYPIAFGAEAHLNENIEPIFYKPNIDNEQKHPIYKPFVLPYYLMSIEEWLAFLMASERTQKPFWDRVLQESFKFYKIFNAQDNKDAAKFANYVKWKLRQMLFNIITRVDSDTSKMTAAKGAVAMLRKTCSQMKDKVDENVIGDLIRFLETCDKLCLVTFGNNNNTLSNALNTFVSNNGSRRYVCLSPKLNRGNVESYETSLTDNANDGFIQIDEDEAISVNQNKLRPGEYFDYHYLQTAVDIVLTDEESKGNLHIRDFVSTLITRLDFFLYNSECSFMRVDGSEYLNTTEYLKKVFGISCDADKSKQLITIDSSEVGTDVLELMTSVISRMIFDYRKSRVGEERQRCPIHLILDEAHRYIRKDADYILRENIFEKIAREGRKYSLYLIVSSQRPSELSQTVLSQCGNYIVHRIQNEVDMKYIYSVLPYFSEDYLTKIRQAVPGEALIFGNCVPMPLMVKVEEASPAPNSRNCDIRKEWFIPKQHEILDDDDL